MAQAAAAAPIPTFIGQNVFLASATHKLRVATSADGKAHTSAAGELFHVADGGQGKVVLTGTTSKLQLGSKPDGTIYSHSNKDMWEKFTLAPVGQGTWHIVSHHKTHLACKADGSLSFATHKDANELWSIITDAEEKKAAPSAVVMHDSKVDEKAKGSRGCLMIIAHKATGLPDIQLVGKMDPLLKMKILKRALFSKEHDNGGKDPVWNDQVFMFPLNGESENAFIILKAINKNIVKNTTIAQCSLPVKSLMVLGPQKKEYDLQRDNKAAGKLHLTTHWIPPVVLVAHEGRKLTDVQLIGKQDPFIKMKLGKVHRKGPEVNNGGTDPNFNKQAFFFNPAFTEKDKPKATALAAPFNINDQKIQDMPIEIEVWDANVVADKIIGSHTIKVGDVLKLANKKETTFLPLKGKDGAVAGELGITVNW